MITQPLSDFPLLENFVHGDDRYRNAGFKLIPHIAKGSWIVKQSVGKTACLIGEALEITYHSGKNYIEVRPRILRTFSYLLLAYFGETFFSKLYLTTVVCCVHSIQLDVDIGSSSVAKGVVNLVLGYLSTLVIELAFLIQVCSSHCIWNFAGFCCYNHTCNFA